MSVVVETVGIDTIAGNFANWPGSADTELFMTFGAQPGHEFVTALPARFLTDGVDRRADRAGAINDGRGAAQNLNPFIAP